MSETNPLNGSAPKKRMWIGASLFGAVALIINMLDWATSSTGVTGFVSSASHILFAPFMLLSFDGFNFGTPWPNVLLGFFFWFCTGAFILKHEADNKRAILYAGYLYLAGITKIFFPYRFPPPFPYHLFLIFGFLHLRNHEAPRIKTAWKTVAILAVWYLFYYTIGWLLFGLLMAAAMCGIAGSC